MALVREVSVKIDEDGSKLAKKVMGPEMGPMAQPARGTAPWALSPGPSIPNSISFAEILVLPKKLMWQKVGFHLVYVRYMKVKIHNTEVYCLQH